MQAAKPEHPHARANVNLTARSVDVLSQIAALTGNTRTDTINKAIQFYGHIQKLLNSGGSLYTRDSDSSELERVRIF